MENVNSMKTDWEYHTLWRRLVPLYDPREAQAIVRTLLEEGYGLAMAEAITGGVERLPQEMKDRLTDQMGLLCQGVPIQQVLGFAWFCNRRFGVSPDVLTPRPETEELCRWMLQDQGGRTGVALLDIGTGSGCIACTMALDLPQAKVAAIDVSAAALDVARQNAHSLGAEVHFIEADILRLTNCVADRVNMNNRYDVIVSNPPYITNKERTEMHRNVLEHEPHAALFVPDDDPLLFYRHIARLGLDALRPDGSLYFEINPLFSQDLQDVLQGMGYTNIVIKKDEQGKERMARAQRAPSP